MCVCVCVLLEKIQLMISIYIYIYINLYDIKNNKKHVISKPNLKRLLCWSFHYFYQLIIIQMHTHYTMGNLTLNEYQIDGLHIYNFFFIPFILSLFFMYVHDIHIHMYTFKTIWF